jgi:hypothetical protein
MSDKNTHAADAVGTTVPGLRVETIDVVDELADVAGAVASLLCTFVFATPRNLLTRMEQQGRGYLEPGLPVLIVKVLTDENIRACIDAISDDQAMKNIYGAQILNLMDSWKPDI